MDRLRSVRSEHVAFNHSDSILMDHTAEGRNKAGDKASWVSIRRRRSSEVSSQSSSSLELIRRGPSASFPTNYTSHALIPLHPLTILPRIRPHDWMLNHLEGGTSCLVKDEVNRTYHIEPSTKTLERHSPSAEPANSLPKEAAREIEIESEHQCAPSDPRMVFDVTNLISRSDEDDRPLAKLADIWLWRKFSSSFPETSQPAEGLQCNEMIITKHGRCLFPTLRYSIKNLRPKESYSFAIEMREIRSGCKFKFRQGKWCPKEESKVNELTKSLSSYDSKDERAALQVTERVSGVLLNHPEGFKEGEFWTSQGISFSKLKLTNRKSNLPSVTSQSIVPNVLVKERVRKPQGRASPKFTKSSNSSSLVYRLSSFHYYEPILHIFQQEQLYHWEVGFPESRFMAVTHYQNQWINHLKKNYNPHAKGFKEGEGGATDDDHDNDHDNGNDNEDDGGDGEGDHDGDSNNHTEKGKRLHERRTGIQTRAAHVNELDGYDERQRKRRKRNTILLPVKKLLRPEISSDWSVKEIEAIQLLSFWSDRKQSE